MELELDPSQPPEVVAALARILVPAETEPDPWWQAGLDEALGLDAQGDVTAPPRSSLGAERA